MTIRTETTAFAGWENNLKISNGDAEIIVTLDVGPRVISYRLANGPNVFKVYEGMAGGRGEPTWRIRGGHRLWVAPEDPQRTYHPDNAPVAHEILGHGKARFTPPPEADHGLQKEMEITLAPKGAEVTVIHRVTNVGAKPTQVAPWALTVMAPGGRAIVPLPPKRPHPGDPKNARSAADFAPEYVMAVWPFTDFGDGRWHFGTSFLTLRQDARLGATKLGLLHRAGGVGYVNAGTLFVKRFPYAEGESYPDKGVNFETYTDGDMLEVESLGPLTMLAPGASVEHVETWDLHQGFGEAVTEKDIAFHVAPFLLR